MNEPRTLAIDIGGSGIKAALLDDTGRMIGRAATSADPAQTGRPR